VLVACKAEPPVPTPALEKPGPVDVPRAASVPPSAADAAPSTEDASAGATASSEATDDTSTQPAALSEPHSVLILGDSMAATGFGVLLAKRLDAHEHIRCFRKAKSASGLARPDFYDWMAESRRQVELRQPALVIVIIGGNDGQDLTTTRRGGARVRWSDPGWPQAYRRRVQEFLVGLSAPGRKILWLGLPPMGPPMFDRKLAIIRAIQEEVVWGMGDAGVYLDTTPYLTDDGGQLLRQARVGERRRPQAIRADDGIHFTMAGSHYFADKVYPEVLAVLGLDHAE
jgi:hypothetical protein